MILNRREERGSQFIKNIMLIVIKMIKRQSKVRRQTYRNINRICTVFKIRCKANKIINKLV